MSSLLSEKEFQQQVIELAQLLGWRVAHFRPAKTERGWRTPVQADGAGFPDLVLVRPGVCIVAELKSEKGKLRPDQQMWLEAFAGAKIRAYVWRPSDFDDVVAVLQAGQQQVEGPVGPGGGSRWAYSG